MSKIKLSKRDRLEVLMMAHRGWAFIDSEYSAEYHLAMSEFYKKELMKTKKLRYIYGTD